MQYFSDWSPDSDGYSLPKDWLLLFWSLLKPGDACEGATESGGDRGDHKGLSQFVIINTSAEFGLR